MNRPEQETHVNIPDWLLTEEDYHPASDRDHYLGKSAMKLLRVLSQARNPGLPSDRGISPFFRLITAIYWIVLVSLARNNFFVWFMLGMVLIRYCFLPLPAMKRVLGSALGASLLSALILLPAVFMSNGQALPQITAKVFFSVSILVCVTAVTSWSQLTASLKILHIPDIFLLTLDMTMKYIVLLGDMCTRMLEAIRLRSIGHNPRKESALSGVAGTTFLRSREMAEETHEAMICRGFDGSYHRPTRFRFRLADLGVILLSVLITMLFYYMERLMP